MSFAKHFLLILSIAAFVNALATPHAAHFAHHRALAARVAAPAPVDLFPSVAIRKRASTRRCKPRPSSSVLPPPSSSPAQVHTSSAPPHTTSQAPPPPPPPTTKEEKPTTTQESKPAPTPAPEPPKPTPTPSTQVAPSKPPANAGNSGNGPSFLFGTQAGQGTFYATGLGACGITNNDGEHIAAVSQLLFDQFPGAGVNPNQNPVCGRKIIASYQGKSVTVTVTDRCEACKQTDLDFSPSAFNTLADPGLGRIDITWQWA